MKTGWASLLGGAAVLILTMSAGATSVDPLQLGGPDGSANIPAILPGDLNGDGVVNAADFIIVKRGMRNTSSDIEPKGDLTGPTLGFSDLQAVVANMGATQEIPPPVIPEPLTMGLFALGMLAAAKGLRGRLSIPR